MQSLTSAVPNSAISGQTGLERCDGASSPQSPRSRSRLTTSAPKTGRCVVCTAEPHLAYDCSALALRSLKSQQLIYGLAKTNDFPILGKSFVFTCRLRIVLQHYSLRIKVPEVNHDLDCFRVKFPVSHEPDDNVPNQHLARLGLLAAPANW